MKLIYEYKNPKGLAHNLKVFNETYGMDILVAINAVLCLALLVRIGQIN